VAADDAENYSDGTYTDENLGSGFAGPFTPKNFGDTDEGGTFLSGGGRQVQGGQSFAIFSDGSPDNGQGTGFAVTRSFSSPLGGSDTYRIEFLVRLDLNPNDGQAAGVVLSESATGDQTNWDDGERLFVGITGDGTWKHGAQGSLQTLGDGNGGNFAANGGDIYRVVVETTPGSDAYTVQVGNTSGGVSSAEASGTLAGTAGAAIQTIGFGNGVVGSGQNFIFGDIAVTQNPSSASGFAVDGTLDEPNYLSLATKQNQNAGFGAKDVQEIVYFPDTENRVLYLGVKGALVDDGSNDGIGLMLDFNALSGASAGTALGGVSNGGHYLGNANNSDFRADFEVDYLLYFTPGSNADANSLFSGLVRRNGSGTATADFLAEADLVGTAATAPNDANANDGSSAPVFAEGSAEMAYSNAATGQTGLEMRIPFDQLGITAESGLQAFAYVVSNTAFFSDVTVPGDVTGGNLGNNPNFGQLNGGPFHGSTGALPVELASFAATAIEGGARLQWTTASETANAGFAVQHAASGESFETIGYRQSKADGGTSTEGSAYRFTVDDLSTGTHRFRLKQEDLDGSSSVSEVQTVTVGLDGPVAVESVAPNPVQGQATLRFAVKERQPVTVSLYDVMGRRVATLYDGTPAAGETESVRLNGGSLSSGLYVIRVDGASFQRTRRVTVVD
jgi:hypothetical protein